LPSFTWASKRYGTSSFGAHWLWGNPGEHPHRRDDGKVQTDHEKSLWLSALHVTYRDIGYRHPVHPPGLAICLARWCIRRTLVPQHLAPPVWAESSGRDDRGGGGDPHRQKSLKNGILVGLAALSFAAIFFLNTPFPMIVAAAGGTVLFVASLPFTLPTRSVTDSFDLFVVRPWKFSFVREFPDENM
jgi:hypothetical protein